MKYIKIIVKLTDFIIFIGITKIILIILQKNYLRSYYKSTIIFIQCARAYFLKCNHIFDIIDRFILFYE